MNKEIEVKKELITPQRARQFLQNNFKNRNLRQSLVSKYASDISKNQWGDTAETIKIAENGNLIDGQHRLSAIVQSDKSVSLYVAYNVPDSAFKVIDSGAARTATDVISLVGHKNASILSSASRILIPYFKDRILLLNGARVTNTDILEFVDKNPDLQKYATKANLLRKEGLGSPASALASFYLIDRFSESKSKLDGFIEKLIFGYDLERGDPILYSRRLLMKDNGSQRSDRLYQMLVIVSAWNRYIDNEESKWFKIMTKDNFKIN